MTAVGPGREVAPATTRAPVTVLLGVVAAHRTGLPLHRELLALGARSVGVARTAPLYRLVALPGRGVARGGLVLAADGASIEVELHRLPTRTLGALLCRLPAPLAVGRMQLAPGTETGPEDVLGILCTAPPPGALDVSVHGSWPAYLAARGPGPV